MSRIELLQTLRAAVAAWPIPPYSLTDNSDTRNQFFETTQYLYAYDQGIIIVLEATPETSVPDFTGEETTCAYRGGNFYYLSYTAKQVKVVGTFGIDGEPVIFAKYQIGKILPSIVSFLVLDTLVDHIIMERQWKQ